MGNIWWRSLLANTDVIKSIHIDLLASSIFHSKSLKRDDLYREPPMNSIGSLQRVLESTRKLAPGSYLLEHSPGSVHVCIYRVQSATEQTSGRTTRLSAFYRDVLI